MSTFDTYAAQRRQEKQAEPVVLDEQGEPIQAGSNGLGYVFGVLLIVGGVLCLAFSFGLSALGILCGCFAFGGEKVTDSGCRAMHQQAAEQDPAGVNREAGNWFGRLAAYVLVGVVIIVGLFLLLASAGQIAGFTL